MAIAARRSISPSSLRRWAVASMDLTMAPPPFLIASHRKQILGNHTPAHVALKSKLSFIGGSPHGEGMLQGADGGFTAGPAAPPFLPQEHAPPARLWQKRNRGRRWPSRVLARSTLDVVGEPGSRPSYRPDYPRKLGSRSRCRF